MIERVIIPMMHVKVYKRPITEASPLGGSVRSEFNPPNYGGVEDGQWQFGDDYYDAESVYYYDCECLIQPAKQASKSTANVAFQTKQITDTYIVTTESPLFRPDRVFDTNEPSWNFVVFMFYKCEWWYVDSYQEFKDSTGRNLKQAIFVNQRQFDSDDELLIRVSRPPRPLTSNLEWGTLPNVDYDPLEAVPLRFMPPDFINLRDFEKLTSLSNLKVRMGVTNKFNKLITALQGL